MVTSERETEKGPEPACSEEMEDKVGANCL